MAEFKPSAIPILGKQPPVIAGAFVDIVRYLFSNDENIEQKDLKSLVWNPDAKLSGILIETAERWSTNNTQQRPAVFFKRGPWEYQQIGIGDRYQGPPEETGFAEAVQMVGCAGSHEIRCVGRTNWEAELIATEIMRHFIGFSSVIREQLCLNKFRVKSIGQITKFDESSEHEFVPVTLEYMFVDNWKLLRQTPEWARTVQIMTYQ